MDNANLSLDLIVVPQVVLYSSFFKEFKRDLL